MQNLGGYENFSKYFHGVRKYLVLFLWDTEIFLAFENFTLPRYSALKMTGPLSTPINF